MITAKAVGSGAVVVWVDAGTPSLEFQWSRDLEGSYYPAASTGMQSSGNHRFYMLHNLPYAGRLYIRAVHSDILQVEFAKLSGTREITVSLTCFAGAKIPKHAIFSVKGPCGLTTLRALSDVVFEGDGPTSLQAMSDTPEKFTQESFFKILFAADFYEQGEWKKETSDKAFSIVNKDPIEPYNEITGPVLEWSEAQIPNIITTNTLSAPFKV